MSSFGSRRFPERQTLIATKFCEGLPRRLKVLHTRTCITYIMHTYVHTYVLLIRSFGTSSSLNPTRGTLMKHVRSVFSTVCLFAFWVRTRHAARRWMAKLIFAIFILGVTLCTPPSPRLTLPFQGVHEREDLWPEPMRYNPSRFTEAVAPYTFLPFIDGPRNCLGQHLSLLESKVFFCVGVESVCCCL